MKGKVEAEKEELQLYGSSLLIWHGYIEEHQLLVFHHGIKVISREVAHFVLV